MSFRACTEAKDTQLASTRSSRAPCAFPNLRCCPRCWLFSCLGLWSHPHISPKEHQKERCGHYSAAALLHYVLWCASEYSVVGRISCYVSHDNTRTSVRQRPFAENFFLLAPLLNRIDSIPASENAGTLYLRIYPYVDPDKITTMFLFATSPLLSQSGNTKSSIKGNTLNSDSLNRKSPCSSSLYKRRHCLPSVTSQTRLLLFNKYLWLHKQKIKSHQSSARSAISLASLTASAS